MANKIKSVTIMSLYKELKELNKESKKVTETFHYEMRRISTRQNEILKTLSEMCHHAGIEVNNKGEY